MSKESLNAIVIQKIEISPELVVLQVAPDGWELPSFEAGQFAVLGLPAESARTAWSDPEEDPPEAGRLIRRAYSIASSSAAREGVVSLFLDFKPRRVVYNPLGVFLGLVNHILTLPSVSWGNRHPGVLCVLSALLVVNIQGFLYR